MNKAWRVARHEYARHVLRRSFLLTLLVVPLVILVSVVAVALSGRAPAPSREIALVDSGGVLASSRADGAVRVFASETEAEAALSAGRLGGYALLPPDYPENRRLEVVSTVPVDRVSTQPIRSLLRRHLVSSRPEAAARRAAEGTRIVVRTPDGGREYSGGVTGGMVLPPLAGLFLLLLIFFGAGDLLEAVVEEKTGRTLEILATSLSPARFLLGKILGITAATLTLLLAWLACAAGAVAIGGLVLGRAWLADLAPEPLAVAYLGALVTTAYLFVAAGLVAVGTTLTEARAGRQVTIVLLSVFLGTVSFTMPLMEDPRSPLAVLLSLLPIFSTVLLPARHLFVEVPAWQFAVAVGLQLALALLTLRLAGRSLRLGAGRFTEAVDWRELFGRPRPAAAPAPAREPRPAPARARRRRSRGGWKTWLVARHEARTILSKPLFVGLTLGLPLLLGVQLFAFEAATSHRSAERAAVRSASIATARERPAEREVHGYVDPAGFVRRLPEDLPADRLRAFPTEAEAARALADGTIDAWSLVPPDYLATGRLVVVRPDANPLGRGRAAGPMPRVLLLNTLDGDARLAALVREPMTFAARSQAPVPAPEAVAATSDAAEPEEGRVDEVIGLLTMLILYAVVLLASGLLLQSVSDEKKNRTMELLLVALRPRQLLAGKVLGLGFVGLLQASVWAAVFAGALVLTGKTASLPPGLAAGPSALVWGALLFLFGYAVYAGLTASAGALVPDLKEAQGVGFMLAVPALVGFVAAEFQLDAPHGPVMTGLSLFPLTAPFVMMLRLVTGEVPAWQLVLALALMGLTAVAVIRAAARMFRAQHLLSGERFSFRRLASALLRG